MNTSADANETVYLYGGDYFQLLYDIYTPAHLPLSGTICAFGIISNTINVAVLTRRSMRSPTNTLLTGLSVAQLCLVTNYLILLAYNVSASSCLWLPLHGYAFLFYKWINVNLNVVFHSVATCHTLMISVLRFLAVQAPTYSRTRINVQWSKTVVVVIYCVVPVLCTPMFFMSYVAESEQYKGTCDLDVVYELEYTGSELLIEVAMWEFGVLFKLVPSLTIAILSLFLIKSLRNYRKMKARLIKNNSNNVETDGSEKLLASPPSTPIKRQPRRSDRKQLTKMLIAVALLCVSVELPHGIVNLMTAIFGQRFATEVYDNLGDIFEMLTLLYSSVNFVLYCLISVEYQKAFISLFSSCVKKMPRIDAV